jgi:hypothetical protein
MMRYITDSRQKESKESWRLKMHWWDDLGVQWAYSFNLWTSRRDSNHPFLVNEESEREFVLGLNSLTWITTGSWRRWLHYSWNETVQRLCLCHVLHAPLRPYIILETLLSNNLNLHSFLKALDHGLDPFWTTNIILGCIRQSPTPTPTRKYC